jgi:hypothetical protein
MNTSDKIKLASNTAVLCLHKEGIFYKLYNQHAMLFTQNIKTLKIKDKFIKAVNQWVYSCGFPDSIIEGIKKQLLSHGGMIDESEKLLKVTSLKWKKESDYSKWCVQQKQDPVEVTAGKTRNAELTNIEKQIAAFQVMRKTPMDAMNFIIELQKELNNSNG